MFITCLVVKAPYYLFVMQASVILLWELKCLGPGNWTIMKETVLSM